MVDKLFFCEESMVLRCFFKILPMICPILIGPLFHQGFHIKDGLDFLLAHGHGPVKPVRPHFLFLSSSAEVVIITIHPFEILQKGTTNRRED